MNGPNGAGGGQSPWDAQNSAAAGNPGGGDGYRATREWGEYDRMRTRGLPYGSTDTVTDANTINRMKRFCPDWDGDVRWAPPGFFEQEAAMTQRADFFETQQQQQGGYYGPTPYAKRYSTMTPFEAYMAHQKSPAQVAQECREFMEESRAKVAAENLAARKQKEALQLQSQNNAHQRQMQLDRFEHERNMRNMDMDAYKRGWGR